MTKDTEKKEEEERVQIKLARGTKTTITTILRNTQKSELGEEMELDRKHKRMREGRRRFWGRLEEIKAETNTCYVL